MLIKSLSPQKKKRPNNANISLFDDADWILPDPNEEVEDDMCQEVHEERVALYRERIWFAKFFDLTVFDFFTGGFISAVGPTVQTNPEKLSTENGAFRKRSLNRRNLKTLASFAFECKQKTF